MVGDLIALRGFMTSRPWAMHKRELVALQQAVFRATDVDSLVAGELRAAARASRVSSEGGPSVGVLQISGPITARPSIFSAIFGSPTVTGLQAQLRELVQDPAVSSIVAVFDSPGGECDLIQEFAAELRACPKPLAAMIASMAASAAYWLAAQADAIIVTPSGWTGSVGVYSLHADLSRQLEADGVTLTFTSAGEGKTDGNPYEPLSEQAQADVQTDVDYIYKLFVAAVARGRGLAPARIVNTIGAYAYNAPDSVRLGLADQVGTSEETIARLMTSSLRPSARRATRQALDDQRAILAALCAAHGESDDNGDEPVEPNADGTCPKGYVLDGDLCYLIDPETGARRPATETDAAAIARDHAMILAVLAATS